MKLKTTFLFVFIIISDFGYSQDKNQEARDDIMKGDSVISVKTLQQPENILAKLDWFQDIKFGVLLSWGPCVEWGKFQSWGISPDAPWARPDDWQAWIDNDKDLDKFTKAYFDLYKQFNPIDFNPETMLEILQSAGFKYVGLTTKHHDGFCLFDTKTTDFKITSPECPFHENKNADITKAIFDAAQKRGLGVLCYFSKPDWHSSYFWDPDFPVTTRSVNYIVKEHPDIWEKFKAFTYNQIEELMSNYGPIDILWLDGGQVNPSIMDMDIDMGNIATMARSYHDSLLIVDRTVGGFYENYTTPEQHVPNNSSTKPWESCVTIQKKGWTWRPDAEYRSSTELIHMLIDIVAKGGNFLMGVGPDPNGKIDPRAAERLNEIGNWIKTNGEAIYKTRPWIVYQDVDSIRYTRSKNSKYVYAHILKWPKGNLTLNAVTPLKNSNVKLLGYQNPLSWEQTGDKISVKFPEEFLDESNRPGKYAWVLKIEI